MTEARVTDRRLWVGMATGAAAWATHGLAVVLICSQACKFGSGVWFGMSPGDVRAILAAITIVLLCVALLGGLTAYQSWRVIHGDTALREDPACSRNDFMALTGLFANTVFAVGILWAGISVIFTSLCSNYH